MKKPAVDYRQFRPSKIHDPQFSHLKLLGCWLIYFALYILTEQLIPPEQCHSIHIGLDDKIPFCEFFVIPYVFWYALIVFSLVYFALYNVDSFRNLSKYTFFVQCVASFVYILWPTRQDLRPEFLPRDNLLSDCVGWLYAIDTNTGVCPSLHVAISIGIASVWLKEKDVSPVWKCGLVGIVILICLSTLFIKQHSAADLLAALPLSVLAEFVVFKDRYRPKIKKVRNKDHEQSSIREL